MTTPDPRAPHGELVTHAAFLRALARGLLADEHLAEDVVQQAFLQALARPPAERGFLGAWLARVVRNLALNTARGEGRRSARERAAARPESSVAHERAALELALQREVAEAVAALDEPLRTVVHLRYFRGQGPADIARELGVSPSTVESRLTRAHALLRRRLDKAWREQDDEARAFYLALAPGPGSTILGGLWMTKQTVLVVLGGASLLGLFLTWRALAPAERVRAEASVELPRAELAPEHAPVASESPAAPREEVAPAAEAAAVPASEPPPSAELELAATLERLSVVLDRTLDERLDPGAILDAALLVAAHEAGDPLAELDPAGRLLLPITGLPAGVEADLCVSKPNRRQETVLTLQIRLERAADAPLVHEGYEREGPEVQLTTWTNEAGELLHFGLLTDVYPAKRAGGVAIDPPRFTHGVSLHTRMDSPEEWKLKATGMLEVEGSLQPDGGRSYRSGDWEPPQVLEGGPWPRLADMQRLSQRMLALHAAVKARDAR
jgi:RNA polymerase sigma factor (sigma-70 family)